MPTKTQSKTVEYTVLANAVTVRTGRRNPENRRAEVVRMYRGNTINAEPSNPSIAALLAQRAIAPSAKVKEAGRLPRTTPRAVFNAAQRAATGEVDQSVAPLAAPVGGGVQDGEQVPLIAGE